MRMNRLHRWWTAEMHKIKDLSLQQRVIYIWSYYKLWIISILSVIFLLSWGIHHYITTNSDNWFFACFANTHADLGDGSEFWKDFASYAGYDLNEKNLVFNDQCYFDPEGKTAGNQYYQMLIAYMESGTLDVLIMEEDRLQAIGAAGRLMDLENEQVRTICERYQDRLVYCKPLEEDYGKEYVPIGIDLSGTILTGADKAYVEGAVLGINALAPHPEQVEIFLSYLFERAER